MLTLRVAKYLKMAWKLTLYLLLPFSTESWKTQKHSADGWSSVAARARARL